MLLALPRLFSHVVHCPICTYKCLELRPTFTNGYLSLPDSLGNLLPHMSTAQLLLSMVFLYNIGFALLPLFRAKDEITDIPLTPAQRKLLGLAQQPQTSSPSSVYSTPPRYARTMSASPASAGHGSSRRGERDMESPLSRRGSPLAAGSSSPNASPLFHKAVNGNRDELARTGSAFGLGSSVMSGGGSPSPSPLGTRGTAGTGKSASVGLSQKWIYDKRRNSGNGKLFS